MNLLKLALVVAVVTGLHGAAWAQVACMVSGLEGQASLVRRGAQPVQLTSFKKLLPGDLVELSAGGRLRLSFLAQGKAEAWTGPAMLSIQADTAQDLAKGQKPAVTSLGVDTTFIKDSPVLNDQRELVAGQIAVRGSSSGKLENAALDPQRAEDLRKVEAEYRRLQKAMPRRDVTPHIFYLAALERLGQRKSMAELIQVLLENDSGNLELSEMLDDLYATKP